MATENRPVSCYLPKDIEDSLTKYCTQNNITRKDKAGNIQPAMGTAIVEILETFFGDNPSKLPNFEEKIDAAIGVAFQRESTAHWLEMLRSHRIPCGPVNNFAQALADPQVVARDMVKKVRLVGGDEIPTTGVPMKFSSTNAQYFTAPPRVGDPERQGEFPDPARAGRWGRFATAGQAAALRWCRPVAPRGQSPGR